MGSGELEGRGGCEGDGDEDGETNRCIRIHHRRFLPRSLIGEESVTEAGGRQCLSRFGVCIYMSVWAVMG